MPKKARYSHLQGDSAYYPFGARTRLRRRLRRHAALLRTVGLLLFVPVAVLVVRQTVFRGGQPQRPEALTVESAAPAPQQQESSAGGSVQVTVQAADAAAMDDGLSGMPTAPATPAPTADPCQPQRQILPEFQELYRQNSDLVGWLTVEAAGIDYPVVQTPEENERYLRRGFDGLYSMAGTLFLDAQCRLYDPATANWIIYGHNMNDGSMFGHLDRFEDAAFCQEHPTFSFDTLYEKIDWQIVMVLHTKVGADELPYYSFFDASGPEEWQRRYDAMKARALFETGVEAQYGDQLLTLSTCGSNNEDRVAVVAKRLRTD